MRNTYIFSCIADHFHLTPAQVADLTDYQINKILFARRNQKTGEIEAPPPPPPAPAPRAGPAPVNQARSRRREYFESYQALFNALQNRMISQGNFDEAVAKLRDKYRDVFPAQPQPGAKPETGSQPGDGDDDSGARLRYCLDAGLISRENYEAALRRLGQS